MTLKVAFAILVGIVIFMGIFGAIRKRAAMNDQIKQRMQEIQNMDTDGKSEAIEFKADDDPYGRRKKTVRMEDMTFAERVLTPAKEYISRHMMALAPESIHEFLVQQMILAGKDRKDVGTFIFRVLVFAVVGGAFFFWINMDSKDPLPQRITFVLFGVGLGFMLPIMDLRKKIRLRKEAIRRKLPELLDLLVVSVEAGLSFDAALRKICDRMDGPLALEGRHMLDDMRMGVNKRTALQGMAKRCDVQEVSLFVTSIIQAERLGSNISNTLQVQADNVRERHRQWVKAMALKAPVKIVLPLVVFILPAIFIVALGPAIFNIMAGFMGK